MVQISNIFVLFTDKKYMSGSLMIVITLLTIYCFLIIIKPFLRFKTIQKESNIESGEFSEDDLQTWHYLYQHPLNHKYDPIEKTQKVPNLSPCDEEEHRVLKMTVKEVYQDSPDEIRDHLDDFESSQSEDSDLLVENDDMERMYEQKLNHIFEMRNKKG